MVATRIPEGDWKRDGLEIPDRRGFSLTSGIGARQCGFASGESQGEEAAMSDWSPLEDDVLLKGMLLVIVRGNDGQPRAGKRVTVRACGFV
jgi:hypothetical protein